MRDHQSKTPLLASVHYKNKEILKYLLHDHYKNKIQLNNMHDMENRNILHLAILAKDNSILEILVSFLSNSVVLRKLLRQIDLKGNTPLHLAAKLGRLEEMTEKFLKLHTNGDLMLKDEMGRTPFHIASRFGNLHFISEMHARDKDGKEINLMNQGDIDQNTALHLAALNKVLKILYIGCNSIISRNLKQSLSCFKKVQIQPYSTVLDGMHYWHQPR